MDCLKMHEFAILSPLGDYGALMTDEFQRAVEQKGGVVLAVQNYVEGMPDYKNEFKLLRDRKLTLDTRRKNIGQGKGDVSTLFKRDSWLEDSTLTFPALFIPSSNPKDAGLMAAQVAFNKLRVGYLLGSSGWNGREMLLNAKKQAEGAAFSVAFNSTEDSLNSAKEFNEKFRHKWHRDPDKNKVAGLSYDAIRIISSALDAENAPAAILQRREFGGVYGKIKFSNSGANENVGIISVVKGNLVEKSPSCETN
jgi:ABC-type branched-subunit amino acid transport system substrate-binding protein